MTKRILFLVHDQARQTCRELADGAPEGYKVTFEPPVKSRDQEAMYHVLFEEAAKKCTHLNRRFSAEGWKRLCVDAFAREMMKDPQTDQEIRENLNTPVNMVPSLDGEAIVSIGIQTRTFKKKTASAFIEWLNAFLAERAT